MKIKSFIFALLFTIIGMILGACESIESQAEQISPFKLYEQTEKGSMKIHCLVDENTGVNYIVLDRYEGGAAITPRLNADGTLYTSR